MQAKSHHSVDSTLPIKHFSMPQFNSNGAKSLEIKGKEAFVLSDSEYSINGLIMNLFDPENTNAISSVLESDNAIVSTISSIAKGDSHIKFTGNGFLIEGSHWIYEGNSKKITINKNVHVVLDQALEGVLNYED